MNIFAIDLGNKRIKMKSERGEYSYPSSYLNAEQVVTGGLVVKLLNKIIISKQFKTRRIHSFGAQI